MQDAWRAYLEMALGATGASKKKAEKVARNLVGKGNATAAQLQALAEDLLTVSAANRESLTKLVRFEVDRALGVLGLATADEVAELTGRLRQLERELRDAQARADAAEAAEAATAPVFGAPTPAAGHAGTTPRTAAKKAVAKKAIAKKAVAVKAVAKRTPSAVKKATPEPAEGAKGTPGKAARKSAEPAAKKAAPRKRPTSGGAG